MIEPENEPEMTVGEFLDLSVPELIASVDHDMLAGAVGAALIRAGKFTISDLQLLVTLDKLLRSGDPYEPKDIGAEIHKLVADQLARWDFSRWEAEQ